MVRINNISKFSYIIAFVILVGCDKSRIFDENIELTNNEWRTDDVKSFNFSIEDTTLFYNVFVNVRNNSDYAYRNLYLFIEMTSPSNKYIMDTVEFTLADTKGKWMGSGTGNIWQNQLPLLQNVTLLESGKYDVKIVHGMREDTLKAISDIGIRVEVNHE